MLKRNKWPASFIRRIKIKRNYDDGTCKPLVKWPHLKPVLLFIALGIEKENTDMWTAEKERKERSSSTNMNKKLRLFTIVRLVAEVFNNIYHNQ